MNVFGGTQAGETKIFISNLEKTINSFSNKLDNIEHLLEQSNKSIQIQEEQTEKLQSIKESTVELKKIIPAIISRLNTIETYYKDKP